MEDGLRAVRGGYKAHKAPTSWFGNCDSEAFCHSRTHCHTVVYMGKSRATSDKKTSVS